MTFSKRNALRSSSRTPPRNCQRTSGWISVSLLDGRATRTSRPRSSKFLMCSRTSLGAFIVSPRGGDGRRGPAVRKRKRVIAELIDGERAIGRNDDRRRRLLDDRRACDRYSGAHLGAAIHRG